MPDVRPVGTLTTPLFPLYSVYGAKVVDFHGWSLPVQFSGIMDEHRAVRTSGGLFDVSHMGEIFLAGSGALDLVQQLTVNDASALRKGQVQYSAMCYPDGGIVDDITVFRFAEDRFMLCVNASNRIKVLNWILKNNTGKAAVQDRSSATALLSLQGPKAEYLLNSLVDISLPMLRYYRFVEGKVGRAKAVISRTGYTGEDGFELFLHVEDAQEVWKKILSAGRPLGIVPAGLGARDTLRLEMKYALYGNDIDEGTDPIEAGLGWIVKPGKGSFIGREAIEERRTGPRRRKLVGFEMRGRGIPRQGHTIYAGGEWVGTVTSGTFSPSLKKGVGLGYVPVEQSRVGTAVEIEVRTSRVEAEIVKTPFYREGSLRKN